MEASAQLELDAQYRAMVEGAGVLERPRRGTLAVSGPEAAELLQGQLTNDIEALGPGRGCYAALLDRKGHLRADMRVLRIADDELRLDTEPGAAGAVSRHLGMYGVGLDARVSEREDEATVSLIGPEAPALAGFEPGEEHSHRRLEVDGREALAVATDLGLDLIVAAAEASAIVAELVSRGAHEVGEQAAEIRRVESGRPRFGREMSTATMPAEAGIVERAVSFTKGCYIGQETVARLHYRGRPNRVLRGLTLASPARDGDPVRLGEREVGAVGTAVVSPRHGPIALAVLRREAEPGSTVTVAEGIEAEVREPGPR